MPRAERLLENSGCCRQAQEGKSKLEVPPRVHSVTHTDPRRIFSHLGSQKTSAPCAARS